MGRKTMRRFRGTGMGRDKSRKSEESHKEIEKVEILVK